MESTANNGDRPVEWYLWRTDFLAQFMLPEREQALRRVLSMRTRYMTVCAENIFDSHNASALIRHCEAFGVQDMYAVEENWLFRPSKNVVRGTDKWIALHRLPSAAHAIATLRSRGYRIVATTPHGEKCTPETFDVEAGPFALVFGAEHDGVSRCVATAADEFLHIPMVGFVESLNVSACAAISMHVLSGRLRRSSAPWRLPESESAPLLFEWMCSTVKDSRRLLDKLPAM